jgi:hypothetical protein
MNIFNELPDIEILDKQIAEAERLSDVLSLPRKPSTNIEEIFDDNLIVLSEYEDQFGANHPALKGQSAELVRICFRERIRKALQRIQLYSKKVVSDTI